MTTKKEAIENRLGQLEAVIEQMDRRLIFNDLPTKDQLVEFIQQMRMLLDIAVDVKDEMLTATDDVQKLRSDAEKYQRIRRAFRTMMEEC